MWAWSWWEELTETSHTSHLMSPVASVARNSAPFSWNTTTFYAISKIIIGRRDLIGCNSPLQWSRRARQDHKQSNMIHSLHATHHNITYSLRDRQSVHKPIRMTGYFRPSRLRSPGAAWALSPPSPSWRACCPSGGAPARRGTGRGGGTPAHRGAT